MTRPRSFAPVVPGPEKSLYLRWIAVVGPFSAEALERRPRSGDTRLADDGWEWGVGRGSVCVSREIVSRGSKRYTVYLPSILNHLCFCIIVGSENFVLGF